MDNLPVTSHHNYLFKLKNVCVLHHAGILNACYIFLHYDVSNLGFREATNEP